MSQVRNAGTEGSGGRHSAALAPWDRSAPRAAAEGTLTGGFTLNAAEHIRAAERLHPRWSSRIGFPEGSSFDTMRTPGHPTASRVSYPERLPARARPRASCTPTCRRATSRLRMRSSSSMCSRPAVGYMHAPSTWIAGGVPAPEAPGKPTTWPAWIARLMPGASGPADGCRVPAGHGTFW